MGTLPEYGRTKRLDGKPDRRFRENGSQRGNGRKKLENALPNCPPQHREMINKKFHRFMRGAMRRDISFELTHWDTYNLIIQPCLYCKASNKLPKTNGIDRLDSKLGYTTANSVPCCKWCNYAKNSMSVAEFKTFIIRLYKGFIGPLMGELPND